VSPYLAHPPLLPFVGNSGAVEVRLWSVDSSLCCLLLGQSAVLHWLSCRQVTCSPSLTIQNEISISYRHRLALKLCWCCIGTCLNLLELTWPDVAAPTVQYVCKAPNRLVVHRPCSVVHLMIPRIRRMKFSRVISQSPVWRGNDILVIFFPYWVIVICVVEGLISIPRWFPHGSLFFFGDFLANLSPLYHLRWNYDFLTTYWSC